MVDLDEYVREIEENGPEEGFHKYVQDIAGGAKEYSSIPFREVKGNLEGFGKAAKEIPEYTPNLGEAGDCSKTSYLYGLSIVEFGTGIGAFLSGMPEFGVASTTLGTITYGLGKLEE